MREELYRLMISQLLFDGHQRTAMTLSSMIRANPPCVPSDRLQVIVEKSMRTEEDEVNKNDHHLPSGKAIIPTAGLDLEFESEVQSSAPEPALYETCYVTSHKAACRAGAFSADGLLIATGSVDASIKILDVERMLAKSCSTQELSDNQSSDSHPVIRTLYDHTDEITALEFHPFRQILVSGSRDFTIRMYDYSKSTTKHAFKTLLEAEAVRTIAFHPSGDYLLVSTQHPTLRLYDVRTGQCFVSSVPEDQHKGPITSVKYSANGCQYVTGSKDGDIKIWDGVSNKVVNSFKGGHEGHEVCSVAFARNGKYVLSSGKDSLVKLWELSTSKCVLVYTGAGSLERQQHRAQAVFNHTEDFVLFPDEKTTSLCSWESRNMARKPLLSLGHNNIVKCIVHSPMTPAFLSCSDDNRARFWYKRSGYD